MDCPHEDVKEGTRSRVQEKRSGISEVMGTYMVTEATGMDKTSGLFIENTASRSLGNTTF